MYVGYRDDRQELGFLCLKDIKASQEATVILEKVTLTLKTGIFSITVTVIVTLGHLKVTPDDLKVMNQFYPAKPSYERVVQNVIVDLRGGNSDLPENPDHEKIDETLKESAKSDKLQKSLVSKSVKDSGSLSDRSFNKNLIWIVNKLEPIIGNPKFLRILAETEKPVKSELSISVKSSSKDILNSKPKKNSRSSSIFAEALVPINPHRWPAFVAGSSMADKMANFQDKLEAPLDNLRVTKEYLETAQSDIQWRDRFWKVCEDEALITLACEVGGDVGAFAAGAASNKIAERYMEEMVITEATKTPQEKLNLELFKQTAREKGLDVSEVRGTGLMREFVPDFMQKDICERPERNSRPNSWEDSSYSYEDPSSFN